MSAVSNNEVPVLFLNTPIGRLLKNYSNRISEFFKEKILKNISLEEFNTVRKWSSWKNREIKRMSNNLSYSPNRQYIDAKLGVIGYAVLLKKAFADRYPSSKIEYNENCTPKETDWNPTRRWLKVDGQDGKVFDDAHGGILIDLCKVSL